MTDCSLCHKETQGDREASLSVCGKGRSFHVKCADKTMSLITKYEKAVKETRELKKGILKR